MLLEQAHGVARLDVLGKDEHADVRVLVPDPLCGDQPLVGVGRRHADVDDRRVGSGKPDVAEQTARVLRLTDHVHTGLTEKADDALAREHGIVCDDYAHGISTRRLIASTLSEPPSAPTRSERWTE